MRALADGVSRCLPQSPSFAILGAGGTRRRRCARIGPASPPRRRPAVVRLRTVVAHRLGRLYGPSETPPEIEVTEALGISFSQRFHNRHPWPSRYGTVEMPQSIIDMGSATPTAGRLRSGDVAPVLHDLRRRDPSGAPLGQSRKEIRGAQGEIT